MIFKRWTKIISVLIQVVVLALVVGWFVQIFMIKRSPNPSKRDEWTQRNGFVAVSYGGLSREDTGPNTPRSLYARHIAALAESGYTVITLHDVFNFYYNNAPLPDKAVFIIFEGGRKDSAIFGQEVMIGTGASATMFIQTSLMSRWNRTFLNRGQIAALGASDFWDVGSSGQEIYLPPLTDDPDERKKYFLTDFLRDANGESLESLVDYRKRVENDIGTASETLETIIRRRPEVFIFQPANAFNNSINPIMTAVLREVLDKYFSLALTREGDGFNGRYANPMELTRMRLERDTSPEELVARIEAWMPNDDAYQHTMEQDVTRWQIDSGDLEAVGNELVMTADAERSGFAWLRGSHNWRNLVFKSTMARTPGTEQSVYLRFLSRESYLRLRLFENAMLLQERVPGRGMTTLYQKEITEGEEINVFMAVRNDRLFLEVDGEKAIQYPLPVSDQLVAGRVAIEIMATDEAFGSGDARVGIGSMKNVDISSYDEHWSTIDREKPMEILADIRDNLAFTHLMVPLASEEKPDLTVSAFLLEARDRGVEPFARLPEGELSLYPISDVNKNLPATVQSALWEGVVFTPVSRTKWEDLETAIQAAAKMGLKPALMLNRDQADALAVRPDILELECVLINTSEVKETTRVALIRNYVNVLFKDVGKESFSKRDLP